jgi:hypothetical protein
MNFVLTDLILLSYLAGFLDGDGCITVQIVRRTDYRLGFQLRFYVSFTQSFRRRSHLLWIQSVLGGIGSVRKGNEPVSKLEIVGVNCVRPLLLALLPYLRLKKPQAELCIQIMDRYSPCMSPADFLSLCELADQLCAMNDSKNRTNTSAVVRAYLLDQKLISE